MEQRKLIRSFVIRQGRMSESQRRALVELWGEYGLEVSEGRFDGQAKFGNKRPLTLEIGFGMGDSLLEMAADDPDRNFVGVEVHKPGIGHLLRSVDERQLKNLKVYAEDSITVLRQCIPDGSVAVLQLFFPDPWPKKRHHKRRLVKAEFLNLILPRLAQAGILHIATDWAPYADEIRALLYEHGGFEFMDIPERPKTKYEKRGISLGHQVIDIAVRKL